MNGLDSPGPYHEGELTLQWATDEREASLSNGRVIAGTIVDRAGPFIAHQQLAVVATVAGDGQPWCSALVGPRGAFRVLDPTALTIDRRAASTPDDPLWTNLERDPRLGVLFIEVGSRRRYRINGRVNDPDGDPLVVTVAEAYPNCPKYIQRRHLVVAPAGVTTPMISGARLGAVERRLIAAADTFFVASANPTGQLDSSHRGGNPGFVAVQDDLLTIPDYAGNSMFNTLGNLALHPRAGLLFVDFASGETLQINGTVDIDLDADPVRTGGTGRAWTLAVTYWRRSRLDATLQHEMLDYSPHNPPVSSQ